MCFMHFWILWVLIIKTIFKNCIHSHYIKAAPYLNKTDVNEYVWTYIRKDYYTLNNSLLLGFSRTSTMWQLNIFSKSGSLKLYSFSSGSQQQPFIQWIQNCFFRFTITFFVNSHFCHILAATGYYNYNSWFLFTLKVSLCSKAI